jgi:drug/metabolite transporter (DMT)-like permease
MPIIFVGLILVSVLLTAGAQILLKAGMSSTGVQAALAAQKAPLDLVLAVALSPLVVVGLVCFGLAAVVWLMVLSKIPVSQAYPFVALATVITVLGGHFLMGEPISALRIAGVAAIGAGVVLVSFS